MPRSRARTLVVPAALLAGGFWLHAHRQATAPGAPTLPPLSTVSGPAPDAAPPPQPHRREAPPHPVAPPETHVAPAPSTADVGGAEKATPSASSAVTHAALLRAGAEALAAGDDLRAAIDCLRVARESRDEALRSEAQSRLRALVTAAEGRAAKAHAAGDASAERAALTICYVATTDAVARAPRKEALDALATSEILSSAATPDADFYTVRRGDSLTKVAAKFNFPVDGIKKINRLSKDMLRLGERLKIPKGPVEVLVWKSEFRLCVLAAGRLLREYRIATGRDGCTPETVFTIDEKDVEPTWHSKDGAFPYGDPRNILGPRWMGFQNTPEHQGFGIHGTTLPQTIGTEASSGCIRMRNEDVVELFGFVPKGSTVTITR